MKTLENFSEMSKEKPKREVEYSHGEIEALREPFFKLVEKLKPDIDAGTYDVIIGDDVSGRIPALALRSVFAERMRKLHPNLSPEADRDMLKTYFVAGGRITSNTDALSDFFRKINPEVKRKALLVTEYIATGNSIARLGTLLENEHIPFDIVTIIGFRMDKNDFRTRPVKKFFARHKIFYGRDTDGPNPPAIFGKHHLSGVKKIDGQLGAHVVPYFSSAPPDLIQSREDIKKLSDETCKEIWNT